MIGARVPKVYSRAEMVSDATVHVTGVIAALVAAPVAVTLAVLWTGDGGTVTATLVYGLSLLAMLSCSALYNMVHRPELKDRLRRIDQSAIYLKIAGTYTPFAALAGSSAAMFLAGIWSAAVAGAAMILFGSERLRRPSLVLYLAIGWAGLVAGEPLFAALSSDTVTLIVTGGCLYTLGVVFFLMERMPFHYTIWHIFVLVATGVLYSAVLVEISHRAALI